MNEFEQVFWSKKFSLGSYVYILYKSLFFIQIDTQTLGTEPVGAESVLKDPLSWLDYNVNVSFVVRSVTQGSVTSGFQQSYYISYYILYH